MKGIPGWLNWGAAVAVIVAGWAAVRFLASEPGERGDPGRQASSRKSSRELARESSIPSPTEVHLRRVVAAVKANDPPPPAEMHAALGVLGAEDLRELFEEWTASHGAIADATAANSPLLEMLVERWAILDSKRAWAAVTKRWAAVAAGMTYAEVQASTLDLSGKEKDLANAMLFAGAKCLPAALRGWARADPAAAFEAYMEHRLGMNWSSRMTLNEYVGKLPEALLRDYSRVDPEGARAALHQLEAGSLERGSHGFYQGLPRDWDWAAEAARFLRHPLFVEKPGRSPRGYAARFISEGSETLALQWVQSNPDEAIEWFCGQPTYTNIERSREEVASERTGLLLAGLYGEQPQEAVNWVVENQTDEGHLDQAVALMLHWVTSLEVVTQVLPAVRSEEVRFGYLRERASPLDRNVIGVGHLMSFYQWRPEDLQAALDIAALTPEHAADIQRVIDDPNLQGIFATGDLDLRGSEVNRP